MTAEKYDQVVKRLQEAGAGSPEGRTYHAAFGDLNSLQVFDVWDSQEDFDKFGEILMPILGELDVHQDPPMIAPVKNIIIGK